MASSAPPVYPGDTVEARSEVIGLKENSNRQTGVVWVRSSAKNQRGETVLDYVRWVMVNKRDAASPAPEPVAPALPGAVDPERLHVPKNLDLERWDASLAGSPHLFGDYAAGEKIDHVDGMTIEEAEHQLATRLYQNTAHVHFDAMLQKESRFGRRLIYGGHVISLARALSFNGLGNAFRLAAINAGRHAAPVLRRRHALRLDRGFGEGRAPRRRRRAAPQDPRREESRLRGFPGRGPRPRPRARLLDADPALNCPHPDPLPQAGEGEEIPSPAEREGEGVLTRTRRIAASRGRW